VSYREALLAKLVEGRLTRQATPPPTTFPGKLADVLDVLRALTVTAGMSWPQLLALAEDNRSRRGGFGRRVFLESAE
jgi:predicted house-cleaning noncanonical NTP pyrophosphatase (MazG superfamily)